eukprot:4014887-Karenia_brevis.AAC.1
MNNDRSNGGKSQRDNLHQFFVFSTDLINSQLPEGQKWKLSQWVRAIRAGRTIPGSKEANQMLKDAHGKCTRKPFFGLGAYHIGRWADCWLALSEVQL